MAEVTIKNGGTVAAVLAVIITNREWMEYERRTKEPWRLDFPEGGARFHHLADLVIDPLEPGAYDESKIIPIDYSSLLPERRNGATSYYAPAFSKLAQLQDGDSILKYRTRFRIITVTSNRQEVALRSPKQIHWQAQRDETR